MDCGEPSPALMVYITLLLFPLLYAEMLPIAQILEVAEAKQEVVIEKLDKVEDDSSVRCSCVRYAHSRRPDIPLIDAREQKVSTTTPFVGAAAKSYFPNSDMWHLSYVEFVDLERGLILIAESNYDHCKIGKRWITLPDRIVGYL